MKNSKLVIDLDVLKEQLKQKGVTFVPSKKTEPELFILYNNEFDGEPIEIYIKIPGRIYNKKSS